jgi:hypothetical protein
MSDHEKSNEILIQLSLGGMMYNGKWNSGS